MPGTQTPEQPPCRVWHPSFDLPDFPQRFREGYTLDINPYEASVDRGVLTAHNDELHGSVLDPGLQEEGTCQVVGRILVLRELGRDDRNSRVWV